MNRKRLIRFFALAISAGLLLSVLHVADNAVTAAAATQSQVDGLKQQKKEIEKKKAEIQSKINSLEYKQSTALAKKTVLDDQIQYTQDEIDNITDQIDEYARLIVAKGQEAADTQAAEDAQLAKYKANMRAMEERGTISYIAVIFEADSFADLLSRLDVVSSIMAYNESLYRELKASKEAAIQAKAAYEQSKADQETEKAELEERQAELGDRLEEARALVEEIDKDIKASKELYNQQVKAAEDVQADINKKLKELESQQTVKGTGTYIWPAPSCTIVTSTFGKRYHPIYHAYRTHYGVDIGAKYGADILAADGGTVMTSAYSSSYGNYIVVSHGGGVTTLYAHLSSRLVKAGAAVKQGDVIGKCGATGDATGPHLHFEISVNGSRVNPLNYYSNYTIRE